MMKCALKDLCHKPKQTAEIAVKVYEFQRNSEHMVAVTSASPKAAVMANMLCQYYQWVVRKFDLDYVSEVWGGGGWGGVSSLRPYNWEVLGTPIKPDCRDSLCWL